MTENGKALKGAYKNFMVPKTPKADTDDYFDWAKPHIKALIEHQLKEIKSTKVIMVLWVGWKKPVNLAIILNSEDAVGV